MIESALKKFNDEIFLNTEEVFIPISYLIFDDIAIELFKNANPISGFRNANDKIEDREFFYHLLLLHSPILCYRYRINYKTILGLQTAQKLKRAVDQNVLEPTTNIPVRVLKKKPSEHIRKALIQFELTNDLLMKCFVSDTNKISFFLKNWFKKDQGKKSIFQSEEWLSLFPHFDTAKKLAQYLSISEKDL